MGENELTMGVKEHKSREKEDISQYEETHFIIQLYIVK